jgi:uncharacterized delta-60 repeat protein
MRTVFLKTALTTLGLAISLTGALARAADGDLDRGFGGNGKVMTDFARSADLADAVAVQPDGKLVVVGWTYTNNDFSNADFAVTRYNADGSLDRSFGTNGRVTTDFPGLTAVASSVVVQPDGKILVAGGAYPLLVFLGMFELVRYNADGTLDTGFGNGGIVTTHCPHQGCFASALALQSDGRIVAAGTDYVNFSSDVSSDTDFEIARYNVDGSPDDTFGSLGQVTTDFEGFNDDAFAILVQPDGRLVTVGSAVSQATWYDFAAARYLANGKPDKSFGDGGKVHTDFGAGGMDRARAAALQPDGRIVAAGFATSLDGASQNFAVVRYTADGRLDPSFGGDGLRQVDFGSCCQSARQVLLQADGKIVLLGYPDSESSDSDFVLARLLPDGGMDGGFGHGGKVRTSFGSLNGGANGGALQPDGRIVAVGFQATSGPKSVQFAIARYLGASGVK